MKWLVVQVLLTVQMAVTSFAVEVEVHALSPAETEEVTEILQDFDRGRIELDSLTNGQTSLKIVAYYASGTNVITTKMKLPISRSLGMWGRFSEAITVAEEYCNTYSNDWHGWRVIGAAKFSLKDFRGAFDALYKANQLGDNDNYTALAAAALKADRLDVFENVAAPHLINDLTNSVGFSLKERMSMRILLMVYALNTNKEITFLKATEGLNPDNVSKQGEMRNLLEIGCRQFKGSEIKKICELLGTAPEDNE